MKRVRLIASIVMLCLGIFLISTTSATAGMSKDLGKMAGKAASVAQQFLDINSATLEQLQQLPGIGEKIAQLALLFGVNDLDGTVVKERITHAAGAKSAAGLSEAYIRNTIIKARRRPVERDTFYNRVSSDEIESAGGLK